MTCSAEVCRWVKDRRFWLTHASTVLLATAAVLLIFFCQVQLHAQKAPPEDAGATPGQAGAVCERDSGNVLWWLAQSCARDLKSNAGCRVFAQDGGEDYIILKDNNMRRKPAGYLAIPVSCVTGIEDSQVFSPAIVDLWEEAWLWSGRYPGEPAARTGLAINSKRGRSQNQLHIHISCIRSDVAHDLAAKNIPMYPAKAVAMHLPPADNRYQVVKVTGLAGDNSPFKVMLAALGHKEGATVKDGDMQDQSIAVVGTEKAGEFYVLLTTANGANDGHAEELLDQTCR